ncbi:nucleoside diphosphate kinase 6 isoform X2 [Brevipalpus obovatus]|uniref:nucleoside diphosphate kinase 6 isoform X2 n=1 Tax=Brevipalpus obovatus TaxID=246614 RepID=UPI003D9EF582
MVKLFGPKLGQLQLTLCLIKPDVTCIVYKRKCIQQIIIDNNFFIIRSKYKRLSVEDAKRFYSEHEGKFFHGRLISFITSGPLWAHILARPDAIKTWRNLMGPTKVFKLAIHLYMCQLITN